jgi:hypothetical protein
VIQSTILNILAAPAYPPNAASPYPQAQQPSAPSTGGQLPPTVPGMNDIKYKDCLSRYYSFLGGAALPYPGAYMQPFFPMPPGFNPYNPYYNPSTLID